MMWAIKRLFYFAAMAAILSPALAFGQLPPDASLWGDVNGDPVLNPSGDEVVPAVVYDPSTGLMTIDTRGLNGVADTFTGDFIMADDVGMISMIVEDTPQPIDFLLTGFRGTDGVGTNWQPQYFAGSLFVMGVSILDLYLLPIGITEIALFDPGLGPDDFGEVQVNLNDFRGSPGIPSLFGSVQIIPEPSALCLISAALLGCIGSVRRRR